MNAIIALLIALVIINGVAGAWIVITLREATWSLDLIAADLRHSNTLTTAAGMTPADINRSFAGDGLKWQPIQLANENITDDDAHPRSGNLNVASNTMPDVVKHEDAVGGDHALTLHIHLNTSTPPQAKARPTSTRNQADTTADNRNDSRDEAKPLTNTTHDADATGAHA